ncbi:MULTISPECIES: universal stress protein [unclassified Microbacterium]|uniref:universal stress protein n=1 Tax=unclassified Microbacterium TaxID=2609290 RepID=UPI0030176B12
MNNTIIVGVKDAQVGSHAVDWAAARADARRQALELIAIVGGAVGAVGEESIVAEASAASQELLDEQIERVRAAYPTLAVSTRVSTGDPVRVLNEASRVAVLLVIGSDYRGQTEGPARGVHGIRIAAGSSCPVVVVPAAETGERRGVVVGIDGSSTSEHALRFAADEADRLGETLIAVSVWTPLTAPRNALAVYPDMYLANMQAATEEVLALALAGVAVDHPDLVVERRAVRGYPSHVLSEAATDARMIVVGTHGRGALARFLLGSISQEVLSRLTTVTAVVR